MHKKRNSTYPTRMKIDTRNAAQIEKEEHDKSKN